MDAVILAGGLGTRLRSSVPDRPKCMADVGGKPFLAYLLEGIAADNVDRVVLSVGYKREWIQQWMEGKTWPFRVDYAIEEEPLGTGGGLRLALAHCRSEEVLVLNGDTLFNVDVSALLEGDAPVTLALKRMQDFDRYGAVETDPDGRIQTFHEKDFCADGLINGGVYLVRRSRLDLSGFPKRFSFEKDVLEASPGRFRGVEQDGWFIDIGIPEDYERAQQAVPQLARVRATCRAVLASGADTLVLDRDGVLNEKIEEDYVRIPADLRLLPGIPETMRAWARAFPRILVITNQRGVGRGLMTQADLDAVHRALCEEIVAHGGRIDRIYTCTAVSDDDPRRKPNPGMWQEALADFPEIRHAVMVGDSPSDAAFARRAGIDFVLM